jgi:hypothetical protein
VTGASLSATPPIGRDALEKALRDVNPNLGSLYLTAVEYLDRPARDLARMVVIAHCVREIANNLADHLGRVEGFKLSPKVETSGPTRNLALAWQREDLPIGERPSVAGDARADRLIDDVQDTRIVEVGRVGIPASVYAAAHAVVAAHAKATGNARERKAVIAVGYGASADDPTARLLSNTIDYFMAYAHLDRATQRPIPRQAELIAQFSTFEAIISARLGDFFAVVDDLSDILDIANEKHSASADAGVPRNNEASS